VDAVPGLPVLDCALVDIIRRDAKNPGLVVIDPDTEVVLHGSSLNAVAKVTSS
jgi:hypothetical protein